MAVGQVPNSIIAKAKEVMTGGWNKILVNEGLQTSIKNVFAGGDAVSGSATVIKAIGDGKKAAEKIDEFLNSKQE
jgi:glutamate synthase (NADPH/NADH) small chain